MCVCVCVWVGGCVCVCACVCVGVPERERADFFSLSSLAHSVSLSSYGLSTMCLFVCVCSAWFYSFVRPAEGC